MFENRIPLFPKKTTIEHDQLFINQVDISEAAKQYGTPLYVYDQAEMDSALNSYKSALDKYWGIDNWGITYAGKAYLSSHICQWITANEIDLDCTGAGEIGIAAHAGVSAAHIKVHGVNKTAEDLAAAIQYSGTIIVDNLTELNRLAVLSKANPLPELWLRFQPGSSVQTHSFTQTGHAGSKFGMDTEQIRFAVAFCKENNLPFTGLHFHQGSQFRDPEPIGDGITRALDLVKEIGFEGDWHLSPGGGWGIAYHETELPDPSIDQYIQFVAALVKEGCDQRGLTLPKLHLEPGRSLVARAGVSVYEVNALKTVGGKTWALIDGGLADNPRHALYGARYSCLRTNSPFSSETQQVSLAGPYCESGDVLIEDIDLPKLTEGEFVAIPVSGAYHLSMASNYNGARRPAVILLHDGKTTLIQRRETIKDLIDRDHLL
jgi:diaminopimelate decarboxylase